MKKTNSYAYSAKLFAGIFMAIIFAVSCSKKAHWGYEGKEGPENWGDLTKEYELCKTGKSQSPIDIKGPFDTKPSDLQIQYKTTKANIVNNGHTIQVNYDSGSKIVVDGKEYELKQFHFHTPSEHTINGQYLAMVAHLVHASKDGNLAVIGLLLRDGEENGFLKKFWKDIPQKSGETKSLELSFDASEFLPTSKAFWTYSGSLTTPPCSEGVKWMVLKENPTVSKEQVMAFSKLFPKSSRPVQPQNDRKIGETE